MALFLFVVSLLQVCRADPGVTIRSVPPHLTSLFPRFFARPKRDQRHLQAGGGMTSMTTSIKSMDLLTMEVEVSWKNAPMRQLRSTDWIGIFDEQLLDEFHAPVKFMYVFPEGVTRPNKTYGSMTFSLLNLRTSYVFIYISGNQQYPEVIAQSDPVSFQTVLHPMGLHIAISPRDSHKMMVMWTQKSAEGAAVKWGLSPEKLDHKVPATPDTYTREDFCDRMLSPAGRQGWFEPGHFLTAELPITPDTTYFYQVGNDGFWQTTVEQFTTPPAAGAATRLIIFADMGNAPSDGSRQHSWDFANHGELPSLNTTRLTVRLMDKKKAHAVVHAGDISYAVGYLSEWDEFMHQIYPIAARIPWMASIGNHEIGWSQSDPFNGTLMTTTDSGGECGVAFLKRFPYAMQPLRTGLKTHQAEPWYSFDIGSVHFAMMSSEHDYTTQSPQWQWLKADLHAVDRAKTPWLVVTCHRAMYIQSSWEGDSSVALRLQQHVEPLLLQSKVDFFFAGHHHSYQRFCKLSNGACKNSMEDGVYHFVMGMAGYQHSDVSEDVKPQAEFANGDAWGATYWEFNQTHATMQFLDGAANDRAIDTATYSKTLSMRQTSLVV